MSKYQSYNIFKDENNRIMIQFRVKNSKDELVDVEPEVLYDETGKLNEAAYNRAIELASSEILESQLKNVNSKQLPAVSEKQLPDTAVVNKDAKAWKKALAIVGGIALAGAVAYFGGKAISNMGTKDNTNNGNDTVTEETISTPIDEKDEIKKAVENTVVDLTVEDVEKIAYEAGKYLNDELKLGISQNSINAVTFIMNQENGLDENETKALIDAGFISSDAADVFPATLETTNVINQNNALTTEDETRKVISYSMFAANERDKELCDAFAFDIEENQKACAELNGGRKENETDEDYEARMTAARNRIWTKWESFETYGGLTQGETGLPYMVTQGSVASQWVALQQLRPYSTAYAKSGLGLSKEETKKMQERINFASGVGKDASVVFVDFSSMYNLTNHNLGEACNIENETSKTIN